MQCLHSLGAFALTQLTVQLCLYLHTGQVLGLLSFLNVFLRQIKSHYENKTMA